MLVYLFVQNCFVFRSANDFFFCLSLVKQNEGYLLCSLSCVCSDDFHLKLKLTPLFATTTTAAEKFVRGCKKIG